MILMENRYLYSQLKYRTKIDKAMARFAFHCAFYFIYISYVVLQNTNTIKSFTQIYIYLDILIYTTRGCESSFFQIGSWLHSHSVRLIILVTAALLFCTFPIAPVYTWLDYPRAQQHACSGDCHCLALKKGKKEFMTIILAC